MADSTQHNVLKYRLKIAAWCLVVFVFGFITTQLAFGSSSLTRKTWYQAARALPIPVMTVNGRGITLDLLEAAQKLNVSDPYNFVAERRMIEVTAKTKSVSVSSEAVAKQKEILAKSWQYESIADLEKDLEAKGVKPSAFYRLFVEDELLKNELSAKLSPKTEKVAEVKQLLESGKDFAEVAKTHSDDAVTAPLGGDAGFVSESTVDPRIWQAAQKISDGQVRGEVLLAEGYAFIQRVSTNPKADNGQDQLRLRIIYVKTFDFNQWLAEEMKKVKIKIFI